MADVEDYLATLGADDRAAFARVVAVARELAPDAEEGTSYGMAALRWNGKPLLGLRAAAKHLSVFPFSPQAVEAASDLLDGCALSKGTVRFTAAKPLSDEAVRALVRFRMREIVG
ncbi:iron chaperone [Kineosporia sp. A_224]|uniref:iron chaperone n=1 Tax=Kineosporia sp. A_224 TaxID=1962180 RepID=UPI000B4BA280|nr:DUF1801 domain-containing protein [Kineosporia sp. A_224]